MNKGKGNKKGGLFYRYKLFRLYDIPVIVAIVVVNVILTISGNRLKFRPYILRHIIKFFVIGIVSVAALGLISLVIYTWRNYKTDLRTARCILAKYLNLNILLELLRFCIALEMLFFVYTNLKQHIPCINPKLYDVGLIRLEKFIHFGWNPAWAMANYNLPWWVLKFLDLIYVSWFSAKAVVIGYIMTLRDHGKRDRFLTSYISLWLIGVLLGLLFPSVGPFYIDDKLFPPNGMSSAARIQIYLKAHYMRCLLPGSSGFLLYGYGLMALPSLHVAVVVLYAIYGWGEGRFIRWLTIIYALLIFIGSLTTGWHYAIDGYAAVVMVLGAWYFAAWLQKHLEVF